jgi:predicted transcriptional regulator YdeE
MIQQKGFKLIGLSIETSNQGNEASSAIGALWGKFISEDLLSKIPHQRDSDIVCVYTNYESNFRGKYTCLLGVKVDSLDSIPAGLVGHEFEGGQFQPFLAQGEFPQAIVETWQSIWEQDETLNRSYTYDYEVYDDRSRRGNESQVSIFIATN